MSMDEWANNYVKCQQTAMRGGKRLRYRDVKADIRREHPPTSAIIVLGYLAWLTWWALRIWWAIHYATNPIDNWSKINPDTNVHDDDT